MVYKKFQDSLALGGNLNHSLGMFTKYGLINDSNLSHDNNNLNIVRLVLATSVIYSHAYYPLHDYDAFKPLLGVPLSWIAVEGFFCLSGFLVYRSLERGTPLRDYAISRLARIWPGLVAMAVVIACFGVLFSGMTPLEYFSEPKLFRFITGAAIFQPIYVLPGVTCGDGPCNVNGSLWTIPWEIRCYVALALFVAAGRFVGHRRAWIGMLAVAIAFALASAVPPARSALVGLVGSKIYFVDQIARLWFAFVAGAAAYRWRSRIRLSLPAALLALVIAAACKDSWIGDQVRILSVAYGVLYAGFMTGKGSAKWGDYSYGMYIYAMPVMTAYIVAGISVHPIVLALLVAASTAPLAYLSWHCVESPALDIRKRMKRRRAEKAELRPRRT